MAALISPICLAALDGIVTLPHLASLHTLVLAGHVQTVLGGVMDGAAVPLAHVMPITRA